MILMVLRSLGYTIAIVIAAILVMVILYMTIWLMAGVGVVLLFFAILSTLRAKKHF